MASNEPRSHTGMAAWSNFAARENLKKHLASSNTPTTANGNTKGSVAAAPKSHLPSNPHGVFTGGNNGAKNVRDNNHSHPLPPTHASQSSTDSGIRVGAEVSKNSQGLARGPTMTYARRVASLTHPTLHTDDVQQPSSVTRTTESKENVRGGPANSGPSTSTTGSRVLPHQRVSTSQAPSQTGSTFTLAPHLRVHSSIASSSAASGKTATRSGGPTVSANTEKGKQEAGTKPAFVGISGKPWLKPALNTTRETVMPATSTSLPMHAGLGSSSVKNVLDFPCTYSECTMGFPTLKLMKKHKLARHDYCKRCDLDCEDDVALINHRIASTLSGEDMHIACLKCGDDFECEAGRARHNELSHREYQELHCPGCGELFQRAAPLIAHVTSNRCKDCSGLVTETEMARGRIQAAIELERQMTAGIWSLRVGTEYVSTTDGSDVGGVSVLPSILDDNDAAIKEPSYLDDDDPSYGPSANGSSVDSNDTATPAAKRLPDLLTGMEMELNEAKMQAGPMIQGLENIKPKSDEADRRSTWSRSLFPGAKPTPVVDGWKAPSQSSRLSMQDSGQDYTFQESGTGKIRCPFIRCHSIFTDPATAKAHVSSDAHNAIFSTCFKCNKKFKSSAALMAHMESSSLRCNIRNTQQFGHILHLISGGFVDVNDDERGRSLEDGQMRMRAPGLEEIAASKHKHEEEQRDRERLLEAQW